MRLESRDSVELSQENSTDGDIKIIVLWNNKRDFDTKKTLLIYNLTWKLTLRLTLKEIKLLIVILKLNVNRFNQSNKSIWTEKTVPLMACTQIVDVAAVTVD